MRDCTLTLTQMPIGLSWFGSGPLAFFVIGERPEADSAALFADTFGLTPRERKTLDLMLVHERDVVGEKLGISGETLRWHIRNILAKTHYPNAAQLLGVVRSDEGASACNAAAIPYPSKGKIRHMMPFPLQSPVIYYEALDSRRSTAERVTRDLAAPSERNCGGYSTTDSCGLIT